jgi:hypothetical protein
MVNYAYKSTGALASVGTDLIGTNPAANNNVISHLWYNGFGATRQINYGNNRRLTLWYDAHRHQMKQMVVDNQNGIAISKPSVRRVSTTDPASRAPSDTTIRCSAV